MRRLPFDLLSVADDLELNEAVCRTGVTVLANVDRRRLQSRIEEYYLKVPDVEEINCLRPTMRNRFRPLRTVRRTAVTKMRSLLLKSAGGVCPFCGELAVPPIIDHFLPKEFFPEYSITRANLVPICSSCNVAKGTQVSDSRGFRIYRHPYFDRCVAHRVVRARVQWSGDIPVFRLTSATALKRSIRENVERQIVGLRLQERFSIASAALLRSWIKLQSGQSAYGHDALIDAINYEIVRYDGEYGCNNWASVALSAVLSDRKAMLLLSDG